MAYTTINDSKLFFNTVNYTGTGGATQAQTGVGFQPDLTWIKSKSNAEAHNIQDAVRGATNWIESDSQAAEQTNVNTLKSFDADGFTVGLAGSVGASQNYVAWNWKAGTSTGLDFSAGDITPSAYSINTTSGFGIYKYTGLGTVGGDTIAHNLGATPKLLIVKRLSATYSWAVQHEGVAVTKILNLDTSSAGTTNDAFHNTFPTSTLITLGSSTYTNAAAGTSIYVCYAFAPVKGYSAFGVYTGNGNANGSFVHTGFEPAFIIAKNRDSGGPAAYGWTMIVNTFGMAGDTSANPSFNELTESLFADQTTVAATGNAVDFLSNGFKWRGTGTGSNQSSSPFIYMAFARNPFVNSEGIPGNSR